MTDKTVPDWVLLEAAKRSGWGDISIATLRNCYAHGAIRQPAFRALCDMILKHEQPPVDPDPEGAIEVAREACAQIKYEDGYHVFAERCRAGEYDTDDDVRGALRAIKLWEARKP